MSESQRIQHIDVWRFIGVSLVIQSHLFIFSTLGALTQIYPFLRRLGRFGELGVLIFFFISGFVICQGLMKEQASTSTVSMKAFYVRRVLRILPPLWLYLTVLALLAARNFINITPEQITNSGLFLCNLDFSGGCSRFAGHTWSLAYEEQFYLLFPLIFFMLPLVARPKLLMIVVGLMILASVSLRVSGANWIADYLMNTIFLLSGCTAALYWHSLSGVMHRMSMKCWILVAAVLVICVGLLPFPAVEYVKTVLYPPLICLLVLGTPLANSKIRAFFQNPTISYLGKISYTVYLWQQLANAPYPAISSWWTPVFILGVWLLAHFSYKYFERPLMGVAIRWSECIKQRKFLKESPGLIG